MRAIILAAGMGTRLGAMTEALPKCLLRVGGTTVIEHILERVEGAGISHATVVVGYRADDVKRVVSARFPRTTFVENADYATTNNIYSLWLARDLASEGIVIINGDDMFSVEILRRVVRSPHENAAAVDLAPEAIDSDTMRVTLDGDRMTNVGKTIPDADTHGDAMGIYKFSARGARAYFDEIRGFIERGETSQFYLRAMARILPRVAVHAVATGSDSWCEIDTPQDLEIAERTIAAIRKEEGLSG